MARRGVIAVLMGTLAWGMAPAGAEATSTAHAAATKCKAPKAGRAPFRKVKAGFETSCRTARKVARRWDERCEPIFFGEICRVEVAGDEWACRHQRFRTPGFENFIFVRCALEETARGRPSVQFRQPRAARDCEVPPGTRTPMRFLMTYYDASCADGQAVARAWDAAYTPEGNGAENDVEATGERWRCTQYGDLDRDFGEVNVICAGERTGDGRPTVHFTAGRAPF